MADGNRRTRCLWRIAAPLAVAALALCAPRVGLAGCTHPTREQERAAPPFELLAKAGALPTGEVPAAPPRCSGPSCSNGGPTAPISAPSPLPKFRIDPEALPFAHVAPDGTRPTGLLPGEDCPRSIDRGPSIFHPPRA